MTDFNKHRREDDPMIEEWPNPEDDYEDEDDWDDTQEEPKDYEVRFKVRGFTDEEVQTLSRYLFEAIANELGLPYEKLDDLEIEED